MKRRPQLTRRERQTSLLQRVEAAGLKRENWRDYGPRQGEEWAQIFTRLPPEWFIREGDKLLAPPWLCGIIDAWHEESFASIDVDALKRAVEKHGPNVAAMLLIKLAARYEADGKPIDS